MKLFQTLVVGSLVFSLLGCSSFNSLSQKFSLSKAGYASVSKAPAITQPADQPGFDTQSWFRAHEAYREEAHALEAKLRANEAENFSAFTLKWKPEAHYLISFQKDAVETLAKYTSNPIFKPNTVKYTTEMLGAKQAEISNVLSAMYPKYNLPNGSTVDVLKGKVVVDLSLYEEDFEIHPTLKPYKTDPMVELRYNGPLDPPEAMSSEVKPLIRHFAHGPIREPVVIVGGYYDDGKILLKDGCFFLDDGKRKDQLLVFARSVGVTLDDEGYIALIDRSPHPGDRTPTRVGEPARWYSGPEAVTDPEILTPLQETCGAHEVVIISAPFPVDG